MIQIVCPLKPEMKFLIKGFNELGYETKTTPPHAFVLNTPFKISLGGHGKVNFALSCLELIHREKPELLICAGASGGLTDIERFDLVAATKTIEHDYTEAFGSPKPLPTFEADSAALMRLKSVKKGIIASGDEDIVSSKRAEEIIQKTNAIAVAWEGAGGAKACLKTQTPFLELRFISDLCNSNTETDFKESLETGMKKIAQTLLELI